MNTGLLPASFWFALLLVGNGCGVAAPSINIHEAEGPTVQGTVSLPGAVTGQYLEVRLTPERTSAFVAEDMRMFNGDAPGYAILRTPAGLYFLRGHVDNDHSGADPPTSGDYFGWYGQADDGTLPARPNVAVPAAADTVTVTFDFKLFLVP